MEGEIQRSDVAAMATGIARTKSSSTIPNPFMFNWRRQPGLASVRGEESVCGSVRRPAAAAQCLIDVFKGGRIFSILFFFFAVWVHALPHQGRHCLTHTDCRRKSAKMPQSMIFFLRGGTRNASYCTLHICICTLRIPCCCGSEPGSHPPNISRQSVT